MIACTVLIPPRLQIGSPQQVKFPQASSVQVSKHLSLFFRFGQTRPAEAPRGRMAKSSTVHLVKATIPGRMRSMLGCKLACWLVQQRNGGVSSSLQAESCHPHSRHSDKIPHLILWNLALKDSLEASWNYFILVAFDYIIPILRMLSWLQYLYTLFDV